MGLLSLDMKAKIYKSTGSWYTAKTREGTFLRARIKGIFKIDEITSTNPVAVGDEVEIELEDKGETSGVISHIYERKNYVNRQSPSHRLQHHIIAANLDQSLLIATLKEPKTSQGFIDRFLVACEAYHVAAAIVINKADLYGPRETKSFESWQKMYESVGYPILLTSAPEGRGLQEMKEMLSGRVSLLSGHSGVGKSSLISSIFPSIQLKSQAVSGWSGKGIHTTTFAEMFDLPLERGGQIIDTPGIREFGLVDISRQELSHYFPEMRNLLNDCQFNNCLHLNEPGCAIKKALQEGKIFSERYFSYCRILETVGQENY
jgi:ribosome biogenesis GTPase